MDISKIMPREEEENIAETRKSWSPKLPGCAEDKREPTRAEVSAFCWGFATTYKLLGFFSPCFDLKGVVPCLAWNVVQTWNLLNVLHQFYLRKSVKREKENGGCFTYIFQTNSHFFAIIYPNRNSLKLFCTSTSLNIRKSVNFLRSVLTILIEHINRLHNCHLWHVWQIPRLMLLGKLSKTF